VLKNYCPRYEGDYKLVCESFALRILLDDNLYINVLTKSMDPDVVCDNSDYCASSDAVSVRCMVATHMIDTSITQCGVTMDIIEKFVTEYECPSFGKNYKTACDRLVTDGFVNRFFSYVDCTCNEDQDICEAHAKDICSNEPTGCNSGYAISKQLGACPKN